jgi:hypothetical protein
MESLVLRTRIEMALRTLEKVTHAVESIEERRIALLQLLELANVAKASLTRLERGLGDVEEADRNPALDDVATQGREKIRTAADRLAVAVAQVQEHVDAIGLRSLAFAEGNRANWLQDRIKEGTEAEMRSLRPILDRMGVGGVPAPDADLVDVWKCYLEAPHAGSESVFAEYVDLLGGFALRDAGFDAGICDMADALVRSYVPGGDFSWNSFTVPARREALTMTMARIIRLGFPEWSMWAVPLAAHEFGHVRIGNDKALSGLAAWTGMGETTTEHVRICVVDAYATRVMGPAYASAALLMRLDPWRAFEAQQGRLVAKRAAVILGMLAADPHDRVDVVEDITDQLDREWRAAVEQTGGDGELDEQEQRGVLGVINAVRDAIGVPWSLDATNWDTVEEWSESLREGRGHEIDTTAIGEDPLRYLLNAAWVARLQTTLPSEVDTIDDACLAVWRPLEAARRGGKPKSPPPGTVAQTRPPTGPGGSNQEASRDRYPPHA